MTNWADVLTWSRLVAIIPLTILAHLGMETAFLAVFIIAALTDLLDGPLARRAGTASPRGADLDGTIDLVFAGAAMWWAWVLIPAIYTDYWQYILIAIASFAVFFVASIAKTGRIVMPHLWTGKLAMALFTALLPLFLIFGIIPWYIHLVWIIVTLSRLEMTAFVLRGRTDMDARTVFD